MRQRPAGASAAHADVLAATFAASAVRIAGASSAMKPRISRASTSVTVRRTTQQSEHPDAHCISLPYRAVTRAKKSSTFDATSRYSDTRIESMDLNDIVVFTKVAET